MSPPQATMECMRGLGVGGSNSSGSLILGPQWKDGDCMAMAQFEALSGMGLAVPAARAYCARPRFARAFGGREVCESEIARSLLVEVETVEVVEVVDRQCEEKLTRCEVLTGK